MDAETLTNWWCKQVDGRRVVRRGSEDRIEVQGIHVEDEDIWIQFAFARERTFTGLLYVEPGATPDDVLGTIEAVYDAHDSHPHRIDVRHAA